MSSLFFCFKQKKTILRLCVIKPSFVSFFLFFTFVTLNQKLSVFVLFINPVFDVAQIPFF